MLSWITLTIQNTFKLCTETYKSHVYGYLTLGKKNVKNDSFFFKVGLRRRSESGQFVYVEMMNMMLMWMYEMDGNARCEGGETVHSALP